MKHLNILLVLGVLTTTALGLQRASVIYSDGMAATLGLVGPAHDRTH